MATNFSQIIIDPMLIFTGDPGCCAGIINSASPRTLALTYRNKRTELWDTADPKNAHGYSIQYPNTEHGGLTIVLLEL